TDTARLVTKHHCPWRCVGEHRDTAAVCGVPGWFAVTLQCDLEQWRAGRNEQTAAPRDIPVNQGPPWFGSLLAAALLVPLRLMERGHTARTSSTRWVSHTIRRHGSGRWLPWEW